MKQNLIFRYLQNVSIPFSFPFFSFVAYRKWKLMCWLWFAALTDPGVAVWAGEHADRGLHYCEYLIFVYVLMFIFCLDVLQLVLSRRIHQQNSNSSNYSQWLGWYSQSCHISDIYTSNYWKHVVENSHLSISCIMNGDGEASSCSPSFPASSFILSFITWTLV